MTALWSGIDHPSAARGNTGKFRYRESTVSSRAIASGPKDPQQKRHQPACLCCSMTCENGTGRASQAPHIIAFQKIFRQTVLSGTLARTIARRAHAAITELLEKTIGAQQLFARPGSGGRKNTSQIGRNRVEITAGPFYPHQGVPPCNNA
ncbi:MAG: hypothetical protein ABI476_01770 [Oxalobacteraceae bacterium]